jgi:hypothetical protein
VRTGWTQRTRVFADVKKPGSLRSRQPFVTGGDISVTPLHHKDSVVLCSEATANRKRLDSCWQTSGLENGVDQRAVGKVL